MSIRLLDPTSTPNIPLYDLFTITPTAPYVALLGDIGPVEAYQFDHFALFTRQLAQFRTVLFIPGNNEAYKSSREGPISLPRSFETQNNKTSDSDPSLKRFILLDRTAFRISNSNTLIIGCSLFSRVPANRHVRVSRALNDFYQTTGWDVDVHNEFYARDLAWLNGATARIEADEQETKINDFQSLGADDG
ncbi:hypothetical protein QBC39DRAFT_375893 [Podospora conica]|nr:hypothetical protein QBC39DRAFT_375893 [Schizothecium conicum]